MASADYFPIKTGLLRSDTAFTFDLYVKVGEKFIYFIPKGGELEEARLDKIKKLEEAKGTIDRLFVPTAQNEDFNKFIDQSIDAVLESTPAVETGEQFQRIQEIASTAVEVIFSQPESKQAFELCQKAATGLRKVVSDNPRILKSLFAKKGKKTDMLESHCKNVASLSLKLAFSLGFRGKDLDNLGAAALVHDIGLSAMKTEELSILFYREPSRWSPDDRRIYEQHISDSVRILANRDYVNKDILNLVKNHEEKLKGEGYPEKVKQLEPLSQILNIVNIYDKKVSAYGREPDVAMHELMVEEMGHFDLKYIKKLKEVLKAEEII